MRNYCIQGHSQSTTRQSAQNPYSPTHGDNISWIKRTERDESAPLSHQLQVHLRASSNQHPQSSLPNSSLKGPSATTKASKSGVRWQASTVPCNTVSTPTPPAIHHLHLHTAQTDQIITSAYKDSNFFSYSRCRSVLHSTKGFKPFEKPRSFSHPANYKQLQALIFSSSYLHCTKLSRAVADVSIYWLLQITPFIHCCIPAMMDCSREDKCVFTSINLFAHCYFCCSGNHFQGHVNHMRRCTCSFVFVHWA